MDVWKGCTRDYTQKYYNLENSNSSRNVLPYVGFQHGKSSQIERWNTNQDAPFEDEFRADISDYRRSWSHRVFKEAPALEGYDGTPMVDKDCGPLNVFSWRAIKVRNPVTGHNFVGQYLL